MNPGARLVLATRNAHKVTELRDLLAAHPRLARGADLTTAVVGLPDSAPEVVEDGMSFEENALLKARSACAATGLAALADDSGLTVQVMGDMPGIFSARWAGRHGDDRANLELLLAQLADVRDEHRGARFVCAVALVRPDGSETVEIGRLAGALTREPLGTNGFGYDPIFVARSQPGPGGRTNGQLSPAEKNAISHRAAAVHAIAPHVAQILA